VNRVSFRSNTLVGVSIFRLNLCQSTINMGERIGGRGMTGAAIVNG
jgi:hypothetical protein